MSRNNMKNKNPEFNASWQEVVDTFPDKSGSKFQV